MELRTDRYKLKDLFPDRAKRYAQKLHIKADEIEYVKKGIPIDPADISIDEGERAAIRLITTPHLDRDGEILLPDGAILDDFRQSPSVLFGHKYDALPIGKDVWIKQSKRGILAKTVYANHQFAEDCFQCVRGGFLNSNSVGFIPIERVSSSDARFKDAVDRLEKDYGVPRAESNSAKAIYTKWLLLEHSDVPVASNSQSLNLAVSKGELVLDSQRFKEEMGITAPISEPISDPPTNAVEEVKAVDPEVKAEEAPVSEPEAPVSVGNLTVKIGADTLELTEALDALKAKIDYLMEAYDKLEAKSTPAPLVEDDAQPPLPVEDFDIEADEDILIIEPPKDILTLEPSAPKPAPAPKALTPGDVEGAIVTAIDKLDLKGIIDKSVRLSLDRLRGRVR